MRYRRLVSGDGFRQMLSNSIAFFTFLRLTHKSTPAAKERCSRWGRRPNITKNRYPLFLRLRRALALPIYVLLLLVFGCLATGMARDDWPG